MQYGFITMGLKTPAVTHGEAFWIIRTIPATLFVNNPEWSIELRAVQSVDS